MHTDRATALRQLRSDGSWIAQIRSVAAALRTPRYGPGDLLVVGTPTHEPWHLVAHLDEESRLARLPQLTPTLVRHHVPPGAPPHLAVDLSRLEAAGHRETVFVVAQAAATDGLLERVHDARRAGATVLALAAGDPELQALAHEAVTVDGEPSGTAATGRARAVDLDTGYGLQARFDTAQHLVCLAAGQEPVRTRRFRAVRAPATR